MLIISYILLIINIIILIFFIIFFFKKKSKKIIKNNDVILLQKDIQISKELLEKQVLIIQTHIFEQKKELINLINNFQKNSIKTDNSFNQNLTILNEGLNNFKNNLSKQDTDLKNNLNHHNQIISKSFTDVLTNLKVLKESSLTLKNIEEKVKNLNNIFLNNKKRGNLGEYLLEKILIDMYGNNNKGWARQYKLPTGNIIDALIKTSEEKENIAIDAKFSLTNYNNYLETNNVEIQNKYLNLFKQDLKNRINEVAKYINIENKISNAIMFIPSEDLFSFIYGQFPDEIITFAFKKRVWITSPTTLSAILFILEKNMCNIIFNKNIEIIKINLLKIKEEFDRWIERWEEFTKNFLKINTNIEQLNITHNKINIKYQKILKEQKFK